MQAANHLLKSLRAGGPSFGAWQMLPGANISRLLAACGPKWILVDMEHGNVDDSAMHDAVAAIAACGVSPIVRIAANEIFMVKRALDAGAHGILVPLLYTPGDAAKLVSSAKFPPMGTRGYGSPFPMQNFARVSGVEYLQQANDAILTCVQIETAEALKNVNEIAKTPGIDLLFVGPFDLGNNIGHPITTGSMDAELHDAIATIKNAAISNNKYAGIYCTSGEQARKYAEDGFHMISVVNDALAIPAFCSAAFSVAQDKK